MKFTPIARFVGPKGTTLFYSYTGIIQNADITSEQYSTGGYYTERIGNTVYHRDDFQLHTKNTTHLQIIDPQGELSSFSVDADRIYCTVGNKVAIYRLEDSKGILWLSSFVNQSTRKQIYFTAGGALDALRRPFDPAYWLLSMIFFFTLFVVYRGGFGLNEMLLPAFGVILIGWMYLTYRVRRNQLNTAFGVAIRQAMSRDPEYPSDVLDVQISLPSYSRVILRKIWGSITWTTKWSLRSFLVFMAVGAITASYAFVETLAQKDKMQAFAVENGFDTVYKLSPGASAQTQRYWQAAMRYETNPDSLESKIMSKEAGIAILGYLRATSGLDAAIKLKKVGGFAAIPQVFLAIGRGVAIDRMLPEELLAAMYYAGSQQFHFPLPAKAAYEHALQRSARLWFKKDVNELNADEFFFAFRQADRQFSQDLHPLRSQADAFSALRNCGDETWPENIGLARSRKRYFASLGEQVPEQWPRALIQAKQKFCRHVLK